LLSALVKVWINGQNSVICRRAAGVSIGAAGKARRALGEQLATAMSPRQGPWPLELCAAAESPPGQKGRWPRYRSFQPVRLTALAAMVSIIADNVKHNQHGAIAPGLVDALVMRILHLP